MRLFRGQAPVRTSSTQCISSSVYNRKKKNEFSLLRITKSCGILLKVSFEAFFCAAKSLFSGLVLKSKIKILFRLEQYMCNIIMRKNNRR